MPLVSLSFASLPAKLAWVRPTHALRDALVILLGTADHVDDDVPAL